MNISSMLHSANVTGNIGNYTHEVQMSQTCVNSCLYLPSCVSVDKCRTHILEHVYPTTVEWMIICIYVVIFVIGLCGNALVCYVVWASHHMRTFVNIFIVNLALADFLVICVCLPPTVLADATETWYLGRAMCKVVPFLQTLSVSVSVMTLSAIAVERYFAICHPLKLRFKSSAISLCIIGIWLTGSLVSLPELIYQTLNRTLDGNITEYLLYCKLQMQTHEIKGYVIFLFVMLYLFPMCLMALLYTKISYRLWKNDIPGNDESRSSPRDCVWNNRAVKVLAGRESCVFSRRKAARMLMTIVVIFGICYLPVHVLNVIRNIDVLQDIDPKIVSIIALLSHGLCYFNSAINPMIYNFMSAKFRKEFKTALSCLQRPQRRQPKIPKTLYSSSRNRTSLNRTERYTQNTISSRQAWLNNGPTHQKSTIL